MTKPKTQPGGSLEPVGSERPLLLCDVCLTAFYGDDDVTYECGRCGRAGFCEDCASPSRHDCTPNDRTQARRAPEQQQDQRRNPASPGVTGYADSGKTNAA
jgi:hypothetical protein